MCDPEDLNVIPLFFDFCLDFISEGEEGRPVFYSIMATMAEFPPNINRLNIVIAQDWTNNDFKRLRTLLGAFKIHHAERLRKRPGFFTCCLSFKNSDAAKAIYSRFGANRNRRKDISCEPYFSSRSERQHFRTLRNKKDRPRRKSLKRTRLPRMPSPIRMRAIETEFCSLLPSFRPEILEDTQMPIGREIHLCPLDKSTSLSSSLSDSYNNDNKSIRSSIEEPAKQASQSIPIPLDTYFDEIACYDSDDGDLPHLG